MVFTPTGFLCLFHNLIIQDAPRTISNKFGSPFGFLYICSIKEKMDMDTVVQMTIVLFVSLALVLCGRWLGKDLSALAGGDSLDLATRERMDLQKKLEHILSAAGYVLAVIGCAAAFGPVWLYLAVLIGIPSIALTCMFLAANRGQK